MRFLACVRGVLMVLSIVGIAAGQDKEKDTISRPVLVLIQANTKGIPEGAAIKEIETPKETVAKKALRDVKHPSKGRMAWLDREYAVKAVRITLADSTVVECQVLLTANESEKTMLKKVQRLPSSLEAVSDQGAETWHSYSAEYEVPIDPKDRSANEKYLKGLQGEWRVASSQIVAPTDADKQPEEEVRRHKVLVKGDKLTYDFNNEQKDRHEGTILLDPKTKGLDWTVTVGEKRIGTMLGIYELKGGDLRLLFGVDGLVRPKGFDDMGWLLVLKRVTP